MTEPLIVCPEDRARFEVLPLGRSVAQAAELPEPVRLTVTCSPKHGPDRSVEVAERLRALGHAVTVHVAAHMVRGRGHLDALLEAMAAAGIDDMFVIGGDRGAAPGTYASAAELLGVIDDHPLRPRAIGIAGYPEGHPQIPDAALELALGEKSGVADYVTTQMCFDPDAVRSWVLRQRDRGLDLPVLLGIPGKVARHRLLEMSVRIGVGPSLAFVRKQRGMRRLLSRGSTAERLYDVFVPMLEDPALNVTGLHYFTFNELVATWRWQHDKLAHDARHPSAKENVVNMSEGAAW